MLAATRNGTRSASTSIMPKIVGPAGGPDNSGFLDLYRRAQQGRCGEPGAPGDGAGRLAAVEAARDPAEERRQASSIQLARAAGGKPELQRDAVALDQIAPGDRVDAAVLGAVEEELHLVVLAHVEAVLDQEPARGLVELDQAAVLHRVVEARVAVVPALEAVLLGGREPQAAAGARLVQPEKVAALLGLVAPVDAHGVVRRGAAEVLPPALLRVVGVGAGIDQELASADRQRERERVGMPVRGDR